MLLLSLLPLPSLDSISQPFARTPRRVLPTEGFHQESGAKGENLNGHPAPFRSRNSPRQQPNDSVGLRNCSRLCHGGVRWERSDVHCWCGRRAADVSQEADGGQKVGAFYERSFQLWVGGLAPRQLGLRIPTCLHLPGSGTACDRGDPCRRPGAPGKWSEYAASPWPVEPPAFPRTPRAVGSFWGAVGMPIM